jgi:hypothetical protein
MASTNHCAVSNGLSRLTSCMTILHLSCTVHLRSHRYRRWSRYSTFFFCNPGAWYDCKLHIRQGKLADMHNSYDFEVPRGMTLPPPSCNVYLFIAGDKTHPFPLFPFNMAHGCRPFFPGDLTAHIMPNMVVSSTPLRPRCPTDATPITRSDSWQKVTMARPVWPMI